jgi:hypothetical protein
MPPSCDSEYLNNSDNQLLRISEYSTRTEMFVPSPWSRAIPYNYQTENVISDGSSKVGFPLSLFRMTTEAEFALGVL